MPVFFMSMDEQYEMKGHNYMDAGGETNQETKSRKVRNDDLQTFYKAQVQVQQYSRTITYIENHASI